MESLIRSRSSDTRLLLACDTSRWAARNAVARRGNACLGAVHLILRRRAGQAHDRGTAAVTGVVHAAERGDLAADRRRDRLFPAVTSACRSPRDRPCLRCPPKPLRLPSCPWFSVPDALLTEMAARNTCTPSPVARKVVSTERNRARDLAHGGGDGHGRRLAALDRTNICRTERTASDSILLSSII